MTTAPARLQPNGEPFAFHTELDLCAAWVHRDPRAPLVTSRGDAVDVVYRGVWTHGFGPDFRDAALLFNGRHLVHGSVEIHTRTSGWRAHRHHLDRRYDNVILHIVAIDDGAETRRSDGAIVPVAVLGAPSHDAPREPWRWHLVGGAICAEALASREPSLIREIVWRLGDDRLSDRISRFSASLDLEPPGQVLHRAVLDGLGYAMNRDPMRELADRAPLAMLEQRLASLDRGERAIAAFGLLAGIAGFLPLSPVEGQLTGLSPESLSHAEEAWRLHGAPWFGITMAPSAWLRARVRPANHPIARIASAAGLVGASEFGLLPAILDQLRAGIDPCASLIQRTRFARHPGIGMDRAIAIAANAVVPIALALATDTEDEALADGAGRVWRSLAATSGNEITRRARAQVAGRTGITRLGSRGEQGLIHLDQRLCAPRRCFECPIAAAVLTDAGDPQK